MPNESESDGAEQFPDCDWCENEIQRLGGNVEKDLCATCLGKAKCGWAPDKDRYGDTGGDS
jgi:hypothetical protein